MKNKMHTDYSFSSKKYLFAVNLIFLFVLLSINSFSQGLTKKDTSEVRFLNERKFFIYKVDKGETLFSISQKFKIPQEEITQFNSQVSKEGLKARMKIWIPAYSWLKKDSVILKDMAEEKPEKNVYNIAVITTLNLPKVYTSPDTSDSGIEENLEKYISENLEFLEGIIYSTENLKKSGLKTHLFIIDSEEDSLKVLRKLRRISTCDLYITNENGITLKAISSYSENKKIFLLSCGLNSSELIKGNEYAFAQIPSSISQCEEMGRFSGYYFKDSPLVTIKTFNPKENERASAFKAGWTKSSDEPIRQINYSKSGNSTVADSLFKGKKNIIFISSSNEDMVSTILNSLKEREDNDKLTVIGLPTWQYFETIDQSLMTLCNVHIFSAGLINYASDKVISFRKSFRDSYNAEPAESAYIGYDAFQVAGNFFLKNGKRFINSEKPQAITGLYSEYSFIKSSTNNFYENNAIHVFKPADPEIVDLNKKNK